MADRPLDPLQAAAATAPDGPLLVVAGAGTGKTRVIEERVAHLLARGVPGERILLLTFTRRAAQEMLARVTARRENARVDGGTFHSVGYRILARHHAAIAFPRPPTLIDGDDAANAVAAVIDRLGLGRDRRRRLPKKTALQAVFSRATNLRAPLADVVARDLPDFLPEIEQLRQIRRAWAAYKLARGYVDFDDVLVLLARVLADEAWRTRITAAWSHVLVDEYQDVNAHQADIARLLAPHGNLTAVGDPRQSIYGFRGARFDKIANFTAEIPGARLAHLTANFRSTQAILDLANAVTAQMDGGLGEPLRAASGAPGERPALVVLPDDRAVADHVADALSARLGDEGALGAHAVLVRNTYQSVPLQGELLRRKIPFVVFGGLRFTEAAHVKDVLAGLRVVHQDGDELAWLRLLQLLDGVGEVTAARLFADFADGDALAATGDPGPLARAARRASALPAAIRDGVTALVDALRRAAAGGSALAAYDAVVTWYAPYLERRFPGETQRRQDLVFFRVIVERAPDLATLLAELALDPDATREVNNAGAARDAEGLKPVTISTIHSAKGLEWRHVFLLGLDDVTLPSPWALRAAQSDDVRALEEEKRLLYVAVTRAQERLHVVHALYGRRGLIRPSRFLEHPAALAALAAPHAADGSPTATAAADPPEPAVAADALLAALAGEDDL